MGGRDPQRPARLGDTTRHGGVTGRFVQASADVLIHGIRAVRVGDEARLDDGKTSVAAATSPTVLVNRRRIQRVTDPLAGPSGASVQGGNFVLVGGPPPGGAEQHYEGGFRVVDEAGSPLARVRYCIRSPSGVETWGRTDEDGHTDTVYSAEPEELELEVFSDGPCCS
ncbi:MAG: PAAR domain-containing protein [Myxococcales bacterium]|nr:PAAR domain-containing protein [Myxococcales bacterium]